MERFGRRVGATPPGVCPLAVELSLLEAAAAQTCGKCVPCRDGLPQLDALCCAAWWTARPTRRTLEAMTLPGPDGARRLGLRHRLRGGRRASGGARSCSPTSTPSHVRERKLPARASGRTVPCEAMCPAHVNAPAYIALVGERGLRRCRQHGPQGQPVSHCLRAHLRAPLRGSLPACPDRRARSTYAASRSSRSTTRLPTRWRRRRAPAETVAGASQWWAEAPAGSPVPTSSRSWGIRSRCSRRAPSLAACCATASPPIASRASASTRTSARSWAWAASRCMRTPGSGACEMGELSRDFDAVYVADRRPGGQGLCAWSTPTRRGVMSAVETARRDRRGALSRTSGASAWRSSAAATSPWTARAPRCAPAPRR